MSSGQLEFIGDSNSKPISTYAYKSKLCVLAIELGVRMKGWEVGVLLTEVLYVQVAGRPGVHVHDWGVGKAVPETTSGVQLAN